MKFYINGYSVNVNVHSRDIIIEISFVEFRIEIWFGNFGFSSSCIIRIYIFALLINNILVKLGVVYHS